MLSPEGLHGGTLGKIPYADSLVLAARHDELMLRMEHRRQDVVEVTAAGVYLPGFGLAHAPDLDLPVVGGRNDERERRVELSEVDTTVVTLENIFDSRERVVGVERAGSGIGGALAEPRYVPDANSLILGCRNDQVLLRVELRGHHVVRVSSEDGNTVSRRAVPDANSLVV